MMFKIRNGSFQYVIIQLMIKEEIWTIEEDLMLKNLCEEFSLGKWNVIAQKMSEDYNFPERASIEYYERYQSHLVSSSSQIWTDDEELLLQFLHNQIGNKWSLIAKKIPGKTDKSIKNHFYSKLRRSIRKLNKFIQKNLRKEYRAISSAMLSKIIEGAEERFRVEQCQMSQVNLEMPHLCNKLKNQLLDYADDTSNCIQFDKIKCLVNEIIMVSKKYRKKAKIGQNKVGSYEDLKIDSTTNFDKRFTYSQGGSSNGSNSCISIGNEDIEPVSNLEPIIEEQSCYSSIQRSLDKKFSYPSNIESEELNSLQMLINPNILSQIMKNRNEKKKAHSCCYKITRLSNITQYSEKENFELSNERMLNESTEKLNEKQTQNLLSNLNESLEMDEENILFPNQETAE